MVRKLTAAATVLAVAILAGFMIKGMAGTGEPGIEEGRALYADNCASCHGADLEGQPDWRSPGADGILPAPPHDETGHTWHHGDGLLFEYTRLGGAETLRRMGVTGTPSGMPAFGDSLSDAEIRAILAFIRSTWPERVQEVQKERTAGEMQQKGN